MCHLLLEPRAYRAFVQICGRLQMYQALGFATPSRNLCRPCPSESTDLLPLVPILPLCSYGPNEDHVIPFLTALSCRERCSDCDSNATFELRAGRLAVQQEGGL